MDIVSRLRQFMDYRKIPITQFADTCNIPRPTLSQLLNGRNKKVSDELIGKIHEAYPSLSVMWLMFGEGNMVTDGNIQTSEAQISPSLPFDTFEDTKNEQVAEYEQQRMDFREKSPENFRPERVATSTSSMPSPEEISFIEETRGTAAKETKRAQATEADGKRKVTHIIVYYSDKTYETFIPQSKAAD